MQPSLNITHLTHSAPMALGRKIDNPAWAAHESAEVKDVHLAQAHFSGPARFLISPEHFGVGLLELQGNAFSHDAGGVDRVYQGFDRCFEQISLGNLNHSGLNNTSWNERQPCGQNTRQILQISDVVNQDLFGMKTHGYRNFRSKH